jgi:predicted Rossmann-fold nucleotide-binding protein
MAGVDDVPVNPFRTSLYSADELLGAFEPGRSGSYADTLDFETYQNFVVNGRRSRAPYLHSIVHAIHDNSITQAIRRFTDDRRMVGIMGGHKLSRSSDAYRGIVTLAKRLSEAGLTLTSGGGPGAMEATHVGAGLAGASDHEVTATLEVLSTAPDLPSNLGGLVAEDGTADEHTITELHRWQEPAFAVARERTPAAESLAIPTWHYGHEPPTPIASHIGKYFENSIREDGLLALAKWGVIFAEGRAGTIQEIFQDAAQNYYRSYEWFSPMVLFGTDYWQNRFPVEPVLRALFSSTDERLLTVTDDPDEAVAAITRFEPPV